MERLVIGRFHWGPTSKDDPYTYPAPWVSFRNITEYRKWAREVRKYRPKGNDKKLTKFEYIYVNSIWTADTLIELLKEDANKTK